MNDLGVSMSHLYDDVTNGTLRATTFSPRFNNPFTQGVNETSLPHFSTIIPTFSVAIATYLVLLIVTGKVSFI